MTQVHYAEIIAPCVAINQRCNLTVAGSTAGTFLQSYE